MAARETNGRGAMRARDCRNKRRVRQLQDDEEYDEEIQIYRDGDVDSLQEELEDELIFLE